MGIRNEFRSPEYPFLNTKTPTDTLKDPMENASLSETEKCVLYWKERWLESPYPAQLKAIIDRVIEDKRASPINSVSIVGIGGLLDPNAALDPDVRTDANTSMDDEDETWIQFVVASQVVAQLMVANPQLALNLYAQDPLMTDEFVALFGNHGFKVVQNPRAFQALGPNSLLYNAFVGRTNLYDNIKDEAGIAELGMYIGNDISTFDTDSAFVNPQQNIMSMMLDPAFCKVEDVPCSRPNGKIYENGGDFPGVGGFDIRWRPDRTSEEKFAILLTAALDNGLPPVDAETQLRDAVLAGYDRCDQEIRFRLVVTYNMAMRDNLPGLDSFADWVREYVENGASQRYSTLFRVS